MDYSVAAQGPIEDLANAVQGLAGDEAPHVVRARDLVRGAITKLKEELMTDEKAGPTCGSCGAPVTVVKVGAKGRAKTQLALKCTDKECGSRTFVTTKAAVAKFAAKYPHLVENAPASAAEPVERKAPATTPAAPARTTKQAEMPAELVSLTGPEGRRRRAEWERTHAQ